MATIPNMAGLWHCFTPIGFGRKAEAKIDRFDEEVDPAERAFSQKTSFLSRILQDSPWLVSPSPVLCMYIIIYIIIYINVCIIYLLYENYIVSR